MKKNNQKHLLPLLLLGSLSLTGCTIYDFFPSSSQTASNGVSQSESGDGYYKASSVLPFSYRDIQRSQSLDAVPSSGDINILVLPIELSDYEFNSQTLTDLGVCLNGSGSSETGYWESLSSFYKKSSYGKLNLTYTVADKYSASYSAQSLYTYNAGSTGSAPASDLMLEKAVANYKSIHGSGSTQAFDNDSDGQIDGVIMVYSCPSSYSKTSSTHSIDPEANLYWAYTFWDYENAYNNKSKSSPIGNLYFWMSYDFIYEAVSSPSVDPHTLIHESGHMLGLDDYYPSGDGTYGDFNAAGGWQMMDENILDHDIFSKMALGWAKPYVVTGSCTLDINPSETSGDCILVGTDWNGTAFDEYMLMELYTPTDLNYLDSHTKYSGRQMHYTTYGVKLYHVDARLMRTTDYSNYSYYSGTSLNTAAYAYLVGATNCSKSYSPADSSFSLLRLISADNVNTFENGSLADEDSLFETGDAFSMAGYSKYFPKGALFDNGKSLGYTINFDEVASDHAQITFSAL